MPTTTDLEQTGRDANILNNYFDGEPPLRPTNEYGRLGQLLLELVESGGGGSTIKYGGRVDTVNDLPEEGEPNQFYFVGLETADNWDEYIWAILTDSDTGHWDRLGSVTIVIDDHLDSSSTNPVQNRIITAAINAINLALQAKANTADLATVATTGSYTDLTNKPTIPEAVTVTNSGDVYIGSQLIRKVLTQAEYDALETKDSKVEYLILEETATEGE